MPARHGPVHRRLHLTDFVGGHRLRPEHRVIAETDGCAAHGHRRSFEHDRARDAWLLSQGYVVVRFTWGRLRDESTVVIARLAAVLARSAVA